jgi:hypothetical protein
MSSTQGEAPAERSEFVTVVAWIFIGLSGLATLMSVAQYFMVGMMMSLGAMQDAMNDAQTRGDVPPMAAFMFGHFRQLIGAFFLLSLITLVVSIGLLKRWNWARLVFIGLMALGILSNVASLLLQRMMLGGMPMLPPDMPADFRAQFESMMAAMQMVGVIIAIGFCVLYGWIIVRLMSATVRSEFS